MYAEYVMVRLGPGTRTAGENIADQFAPILKAAKGFKGVIFFADYVGGEYAALILWESPADYEAFRKVGDPRFEQAVTGIAKEPPVIKLMEVYEPKP
jgi:heme-degrading monooxygenase HmoA